MARALMTTWLVFLTSFGLLPATAWAQSSEFARRSQWWSLGSLVFFIVVIGALIYLTAQTSRLRPPRRPQL